MPQVRPTLLAVLIARDERTQEEIVEGFERWALENGEDATLSLRTLRRWMIGDVRTQPRPAQRRVARAYWGYSMDELLASPPATHGVLPSPGVMDPEPNPAPVLEPDVIPAVRPVPPATAGAFPLERQVAMSTRRATRFTTFAETRNIGPEALGALAEEIGVLAGDYVREPLAAIMGDLLEAQDSVFTLLEGKQRAADTLDLYTLASVVSGLISKASHDLGRTHDAMTHARTMFVCADNAGHLGLRAWARGLQSLIAYWAGRMQEAVRYAEAGAMLAGDERGTVTAWLPALEARARAQLGHPVEARAAVRRAADRREVVIPDLLDEIGGLMAFPLAKQRYYAAGTYVYLGESDGSSDDDAESEAQASLELYADDQSADWSFSDQAGARAELALARVHRGELEGAREALSAVLALDPDRRIGGILASARRVHEALRAPRFSDAAIARDLRDEIESFTQWSAAGLSA